MDWLLVFIAVSRMNQGFVSARGNIDHGGAYRYICDILHGAYGVLAALYACMLVEMPTTRIVTISSLLKIRAARGTIATTECRLPAQLLTACSCLARPMGPEKGF